MGEGEGKEPLSGFQTVFRRTWVGGSLEVLQGPALGDQEKGDAKGGVSFSPPSPASRLLTHSLPTSTREALSPCFVYF